jgi:hypothetical protein
MRIERQNASIDIEEVQNALLPLFQRKLVLVTRSEVQAVLLPLYPESRRIDIRKEYPSTLIVRLELEQPVARILIEGDDMPMNNTGSLTPPLRTYVTQSGYFIESPLELRDGPFPTLTLVDWSVRPKNHTQLFPPEFLEMIASAQVILRRDFALEPKKVIVYVRAKEFHIRTDKATFWFDAKSSLSVSFDRFRQFLRSVPLTRVKEYVDLRVQGAVIYK